MTTLTFANFSRLTVVKTVSAYERHPSRGDVRYQIELRCDMKIQPLISLLFFLT